MKREKALPGKTSGFAFTWIVLCAATLFVAALALFFAPSQALASHAAYSIDRISTDLYVETNGSIHVIERHVYTFSQPNSGIVRHLHEIKGHESVKISSVRTAPIDQAGALVQDWTKLQLVDSDPATQGRKPGDSCEASLRGPDVRPWYSYNISDGMLRLFFPADMGTYIVEADYIVASLLDVYRDVGELNWRYAHSDEAVVAHDVTLRVALPVPASASIEPNTTVLAWGHGPTDGSFAIGEDGSVTYHVDEVDASHYAEAHVLFPSHWIDNLEGGASKRKTEARRLAAISEEEDWVDVSARASIWDNKVRVLFLPLIAIAALAAIVCVARFGRTARTRRWLVRIATTLGIIAVAEQAFFREPLTTALLLAGAAVIAILSLRLPQADEDLEGDGHEPEQG